MAAVSDHPLLGSGWQAIKKVVLAGYAPVIADFCNKIDPKRTFFAKPAQTEQQMNDGSGVPPFYGPPCALI